MARTQALSIAAVGWTAEVGALLAQAVQHASIADLMAQWSAGVVHLFGVLDEQGAMVAAFGLRVDELAAGKEGVIVAAAGGFDGVSLTGSILPAIEKIFAGCASIRIHTARPGLVKLLVGQYGYMLTECVLKKGNHGTK